MLIVLTFALNALLNFALGLVVAAVLGPAEYGRFAVAAMVAIVLATALFDWLRLSATRFYGEGARVADPQLRATLEGGYLTGAGVLLLGAGTVALFRLDVGLTPLLLLAALLAAVANARFDYTAALSRARFLERTHTGLVLGKNALAFALMLAAAAWFRDAAAVLAALAASAGLAVLPARAALRDAGAGWRRAHPPRLLTLARYGVPIVAANVVYQVIVLANRSAAAAHLGFAEAGQLSLPTDMSIRLLLAVGAALDVYLFQLVVKRDAVEGRDAAHRQVVANMLAVGAVLVLLAVGYATAMPAFEALVVPPRFRDSYGAVSLVLLPGVLAFCLVNFALNPVFQLVGRTGPVLWAAALAMIVDLGGLAVLPPDSAVLAYAAVHSASLLAGAGLTAVLALREVACRPPLKDMAGILLAAVVAALAIWPTRSLSQPALSLACATAAGAGCYGAVLLALDLAGARAILAATLGRVRPGALSRRVETRA